MDCCTKNDKTKGETKDFKKWILWIIIAILGLAVLYVLFFSNPASAGQAANSASAMVGGC